MSIATFDPSQSISLTDNAKAHIENEIRKADSSKAFRLYLHTSGCSGYMYETELVDNPKQGDLTLNQGSFDLIVPEKDLAVLAGTQIDFIKVGLNSMFQFRNPNVTGECGCGESFTVQEDA